MQVMPMKAAEVTHKYKAELAQGVRLGVMWHLVPARIPQVPAVQEARVVTSSSKV